MITKDHRTSSDPNVELPKLSNKDPRQNRRIKISSVKDDEICDQSRDSFSKEGSDSEKISVSDIRLKKNRESASKSRKKKKQQVLTIEKEFTDLTSENIKIQKNIDCYNERLKNMQHYNERIQQTLEYMQVQQTLIMMYLCGNKHGIENLSFPQSKMDLNNLVFSKLMSSKMSSQ